MPVSDEFIDQVLDELSDMGDVSARKTCGCVGLYHDDTMFGLIEDDVAYLKADDSNREYFEKVESSPFTFYPYPDKTKEAVMSYYEIPTDVLENWDELARWAEGSLAAAKERR